MDCRKPSCSSQPDNYGLPTYEESQRRVQQGSRQAVTIEDRSHAIYSTLRREGFNNSKIKAIMQHVIKILPPDTKAFIVDSVKESAYNKLLNYFNDQFGAKEFDRMAKDGTEVYHLHLMDQSCSLSELLVENEVQYIAQSLLNEKELQSFMGHQDDLLEHILIVMSTKRCDYPICTFLEMLNPKIQLEPVSRD